MTCRVEKNADVLLGLMRNDLRPQGDRLGYGGVEVPDLEVHVHHRSLLSVSRGPHRVNGQVEVPAGGHEKSPPLGV